MSRPNPKHGRRPFGYAEAKALGMPLPRLPSYGSTSTGDMGTMDERGYVRVTDRKKDMIIVSGFKVFPNELEDVVMMHPDVQEVGAVGVPDSRSGEAVKLVVVKRNPSLTEEALLEHCRKHLAAYKVPKLVEFRTEPLPKTSNPLIWGRLISMTMAAGCRARASSTPISAVGTVTSSTSASVPIRSRMNDTFAGLSST